jgi:hypothetical protein
MKLDPFVLNLFIGLIIFLKVGFPIAVLLLLIKIYSLVKSKGLPENKSS